MKIEQNKFKPNYPTVCKTCCCRLSQTAIGNFQVLHQQPTN